MKRTSFNEKEMRILRKLLSYYSDASNIINTDAIHYCTERWPEDDRFTEKELDRFLGKL